MQNACGPQAAQATCLPWFANIKDSSDLAIWVKIDLGGASLRETRSYACKTTSSHSRA
ncbi:hypothetical protein RRSWK_04166 [Rhodopirellula sp. SWK7]|nr:hypothetical protein RRSWK_04166 [Rhodopirellula sp. SWK7]